MSLETKHQRIRITSAIHSRFTKLWNCR